MNDATPNTQLSMIPSVIAGVVVAAVGPVIWIGCHRLLGPASIWIAMIGVGPLIGLAMRSVGRSNDRKLQAIAVVLTVISAVIGNIWWDSYLYTPFMLGESIKRMVGNLQFAIFTALGAYLAYLLARRNPSPTAPD